MQHFPRQQVQGGELVINNSGQYSEVCIRLKHGKACMKQAWNEDEDYGPSFAKIPAPRIAIPLLDMARSLWYCSRRTLSKDGARLLMELKILTKRLGDFPSHPATKSVTCFPTILRRRACRDVAATVSISTRQWFGLTFFGKNPGIFPLRVFFFPSTAFL